MHPTKRKIHDEVDEETVSAAILADFPPDHLRFVTRDPTRPSDHGRTDLPHIYALHATHLFVLVKNSRSTVKRRSTKPAA